MPKQASKRWKTEKASSKPLRIADVIVGAVKHAGFQVVLAHLDGEFKRLTEFGQFQWLDTTKNW